MSSRARLDRDTWIAGYQFLLARAWREAPLVKVAPSWLGVTKGKLYWHFKIIDAGRQSAHRLETGEFGISPNTCGAEAAPANPSLDRGSKREPIPKRHARLCRTGLGQTRRSRGCGRLEVDAFRFQCTTNLFPAVRPGCPGGIKPAACSLCVCLRAIPYGGRQFDQSIEALKMTSWR